MVSLQILTFKPSQRCKDGGGNYDYRARNTNIVTTGIRFTNQLRTILAQRSWTKITEDPADTTAKQPDALFATPKRVKSTVETLVRDYLFIRIYSAPPRLLCTV